jgi:hypothetical protein
MDTQMNDGFPEGHAVSTDLMLGQRQAKKSRSNINDVVRSTSSPFRAHRIQAIKHTAQKEFAVGSTKRVRSTRGDEEVVNGVTLSQSVVKKPRTSFTKHSRDVAPSPAPS